MKFGICRGLDDFGAFRCAKEAGADYLETGFGCLVDYDDAKFNDCKAFLEALDFKCIAANGFIPGDMKLVGDSVDYGAIADYLDRGFERAEKLGVEKIVLGSGRARSFADDFSPEKAKEQLAYFLSDLASPRAKKAGAIIVLEPLRFNESSMLHTVADGVEIARLSGADNVFALADLYHVYGNNDSICNMVELKGKVCHAHIAEPVARVYPRATDKQEVLYIYREFLKGLQMAGCETCSIEAHTDDIFADVKPAIELLKSL